MPPSPPPPPSPTHCFPQNAVLCWSYPMKALICHTLNICWLLCLMPVFWWQWCVADLITRADLSAISVLCSVTLMKCLLWMMGLSFCSSVHVKMMLTSTYTLTACTSKSAEILCVVRVSLCVALISHKGLLQYFFLSWVCLCKSAHNLAKWLPESVPWACMASHGCWSTLQIDIHYHHQHLHRIQNLKCTYKEWKNSQFLSLFSFISEGWKMLKDGALKLGVNEQEVLRDLLKEMTMLFT